MLFVRISRPRAEIQHARTHKPQEVVGIRNSHHRRTVAEHVSALTWQAEAERAQRVTLAVEGNIGAGKSTFLNIMADQALELQDIIEVVPEPVEEWQSVAGAEGGEGPVNLLDRFYKDPQRYAYTFQHYVLLTRMQKVCLAWFGRM